MSGNRYLLDTNAIIALLQSNNRLAQQIQNAEWVGISIINQIEFLAFSDLSQKDLQLFSQFIQRVDVIGLEKNQTELINLIIQLRQQYRLKLPDAIIVRLTTGAITATRNSVQQGTSSSNPLPFGNATINVIDPGNSVCTTRNLCLSSC